MTSFDVGGLPESILVLHPIHERVDGQPIPAGEMPDGRPIDDEGLIGPLSSAYRQVRWREYATRRGVELVNADQWPFSFDDDGISREDHLYPPREGSIDDLLTWKTLTTILTEHSPDGPDTWCTAYYFVAAIAAPGSGPNVFRGRLGNVDELLDAEEVHFHSPQNLWPDDQSWVLRTDYDAWYTEISGSSELVRALADNPKLDTLPVAP